MFKFSFGGFFVKKFILLVLVISFSLLFLSCPNDSVPNGEDSLTSVIVEAPDFYISSYSGTSMNAETMKLYYSYAVPPEGKDPTTLLDIRPMIYGVPNTEETFSNIIISTTKEYTEIEKTGIDTSIWDFWVDSKDNWKFEANANYNVSFEAKSSVADSIVLVELKDSTKTLRGANICPKLTEEYQTFSFETGSYDKEWNGHLQIALGFFEGKISIKNLKIEKTEKTSLPIGIYLASKTDKVEVEKVDNGVKFTFTTEEPENKCFPAVGGFSLEDNKLYEVTFNASANAKDVTLRAGVHPINHQYSHSWITTSIGIKPIPIKMYVVGAIRGTEKNRFGTLEINTPTNNSVTITDVKVSEVTAMPQDIDLFVKINDKYGEITKETPYSIAQIPSGGSFTFDMAFSKINSTEINWENFSRISEFSNNCKFPESLDILNEIESSAEVKRTFTNNTTEEKYYKISLDSNWKIILEETEFSVIDGSTTP